MQNTEKLVLSIPEVCEMLDLSRPIITAYLRRKENPLPCIRTTGRRGRYVVPRAALDRWLLEEAERDSAKVWR